METLKKQLFHSIKEIILQARQRVYRMVNSNLLDTYWQVGRLIVEDEQGGSARAEYGKAVLKDLAEQLTEEFGKGFDYTNLTNMRKFYLAFSNLDTLRQDLSWSHYRLLCRLDSEEKRQYYLNESIANNWNSRTLQRQINSLAFERILIPTSKPSLPITPQSILKDPYVFEFLGLPANIKNTEYEIESAILDHIQLFLLELGKGFAFVARQQHIVTETSDFFIDLVFYNYLLKCFVIIDLKTGMLTHQDIGQLDMYVRMYDDLKLSNGDNPSIGILLCADKDETIVKYSVLSDSNKMFASKYLLYLPKEEDLKQLIDEDRVRFDLNKVIE